MRNERYFPCNFPCNLHWHQCWGTSVCISAPLAKGSNLSMERAMKMFTNPNGMGYMVECRCRIETTNYHNKSQWSRQMWLSVNFNRANEQNSSVSNSQSQSQSQANGTEKKKEKKKWKTKTFATIKLWKITQWSWLWFFQVHF